MQNSLPKSNHRAVQGGGAYLDELQETSSVLRGGVLLQGSLQ